MPTIGHAHKPHVKGSVLLSLQKGNLWLAVKNQTRGHCDSALSYHQSKHQRRKTNDEKKINLWLDARNLSSSHSCIFSMGADQPAYPSEIPESYIQMFVWVPGSGSSPGKKREQEPLHRDIRMFIQNYFKYLIGTTSLI